MSRDSLAPTLTAVEHAQPVDRLATLFDIHYDRLYRLARRRAPSADDALDLVQETFLKAAGSLHSIPLGFTNEEAWLVRVLVNIRRDQWRKQSVRDRHRHSGWGREAFYGYANPEAALIAKNSVWRALDVLPPRRRAIVVMHELEDLAIPAIAALLGISVITVRWHLSLGRRELTRQLKDYFGGSSEKP